MPKALVTGASRGIGRAAAIALARAGFDVGVAARTMREGEGRDDARDRPLPGSLESTAAAIEAAGREALSVRLDLLDRSTVEDAARTVLEAWGGVDVLVNNAIHAGAGSMDRILDLETSVLEAKLDANCVAQFVLTKALLPAMLDRGGGLVLNVTSPVAMIDPDAPAGEGGWGFAYAASKGAFHRMAGILTVELGGKGVRCVNVDPGFVMTERMELAFRDLGLEGMRGAPPEAIGAVVAWLATDPGAEGFWGRTVNAQKLCRERNLHPDWAPEG